MISDEKLIRKIKDKHDKSAADQLFDRYYREIYAYVYRQCGERELSMDLVQDTFIAAFCGLPRFDQKKASFRTWLYRIAANKITDYYRSRRHKEKLLEISADEQDIEIADEKDIAEMLIQKESVRRIMEIVSEYSPAQTMIFQLKCFEDKTFAEIAAALNLSESTAKTRYYAIIRHLKYQLQASEQHTQNIRK